MSIRSTCKAIVIDDGKILLNKCYDKNNGHYYCLPGGGQDTEEFMDEAIKREVLEETGYSVKPERLVGIGEEICESEIVRNNWPEYIHKLYHIYLCSLTGEKRVEPTEIDDMQEESIWLNIDEVANNGYRLLPAMVEERLRDMINSKDAIFLDSLRIEHHHG